VRAPYDMEDNFFQALCSCGNRPPAQDEAKPALTDRALNHIPTNHVVLLPDDEPEEVMDLKLKNTLAGGRAAANEASTEMKFNHYEEPTKLHNIQPPLAPEPNFIINPLVHSEVPSNLLNIQSSLDSEKNFTGATSIEGPKKALQPRTDLEAKNLNSASNGAQPHEPLGDTTRANPLDLAPAKKFLTNQKTEISMTSKDLDQYLKTTSAKTLASATNVPEILLSTSIFDVLNILETDGRSCVLVRDLHIQGNAALSGDVIFNRMDVFKAAMASGNTALPFSSIVDRLSPVEQVSVGDRACVGGRDGVRGVDERGSENGGVVI
jgi:hypothetical protein